MCGTSAPTIVERIQRHIHGQVPTTAMLKGKEQVKRACMLDRHVYIQVESTPYIPLYLDSVPGSRKKIFSAEPGSGQPEKIFFSGWTRYPIKYVFNV